ncbi:hypothetical protein [Acetobacter sp.]|uniref:hypothetical protein n=1 Tax=Acetobacter sp. TaxID=440 RepID=UPI0039ED8998
MATIIDSLVVQLGLDAKGLAKGGKQATGTLANLDKGAKGLDVTFGKMGHSASDAFSKARNQAVAFLAVLTAGRGLKDFISSTTSANVAAGNMARNLGTSVNSLTAWQKAAQATGATAQDVSSSFGALVSQFQTVEGRQHLAQTFSLLHVNLTKANGQMREMDELIPDLARSAQALGPQQFSAIASQAGFSQGFINFLEEGPDKVKRLYDALRQYAPTERDTKASAQLYEDWTKLTAQSEAFGRSIMTDLSPTMHELMGWLSGVVDRNQAWLRQDISTYVKEFGDAVQAIDWRGIGNDLKSWEEYLKSIDWHEIGEDVKAFASGADDAAKAVGGWKNVAEGLFALWIGSRFLQVLGNVRMLSAAAGVGGSALARLLGIGAAGFAAHEGVSAVDPNDKAGTWIDDHSMAASEFDDWTARKLGIGRTFRQQAMASAGVPYKAGAILSQLGITQDQYDTYARTVAGIEKARYDQMGGAGGKYAGRYQMSRGAISDAAAYLGESNPSQDQFLHDPQMQERFFEAYSALNAKYLSTHSAKFRASSKAQQLADIAYAHNQGAGGAVGWVNSGLVGRDAFGTPGTRYSDGVLSNLNASRAAISAASSVTNNTGGDVHVSAPVTVNVPPGSDARATGAAIKTAIADTFNSPQILARLASRGVQ